MISTASVYKNEPHESGNGSDEPSVILYSFTFFKATKWKTENGGRTWTSH